MLHKPFSAFMAFLLVFAMIPTAFAEDGGQTGVKDAAGTAETDKEGTSDEAEEDLENGDATDFEDVIFPIQDDDDTSESKRGNENIKDEEEQSENKDDDQKTTEPELTVSAGVGYTGVDGEHDYSVSIGAHLPYKRSADGTFEILLDGRKPVELDWEDGGNGLNASASFEVDKPGAHKALVRFQGVVDGKEVTLQAEKAVQFPGKGYRFEVTYDGKRAFGGKLLGVKDAKGTWFIGVYDHHKEDRLLEEHYSGSIASLEYTHHFKDLTPGTYDVIVTFGGVVDGVGAGATGILRGVTIKADGSGEVRDPDKDKPPVAVGPGEGKKTIKNAKGGRLPETATPHPGFVLLGGLVWLSGWVLWKLQTIVG